MNKLLSICVTVVVAATATVGIGGGPALAADMPLSASDARPAPPSPEGRAFTSILVRQDGKPYSLVPGTAVKLDFSKGRVTASAGCNTMSGPVTFTSDTMVVGTLASTPMLCDPLRGRQDGLLLDLFAKPSQWSLDGMTLTLWNTRVEIILGERLPVAAKQPLLNRYWIVDTVLADRLVYPVPPEIHVSLLFQPTAAGQVDVTGILICNWITGSATVEGDTITVNALGTTKRGCTPNDPRVEIGVLTALKGVSQYWIDDNQLTIAKPTGPGLILHPAF
jgi:heat shock protein HslJ